MSRGALCSWAMLLGVGAAACHAAAARPAEEDRTVKLARGAVTAPRGLTEIASFILPPRLLVDFYGARQTGEYLAFACTRAARSDRAGDPDQPGGEGASDQAAETERERARVATRAVAFIETRTAELHVIRAARPGWWPAAVAGRDGWLIVRERRQEAAGACAENPDCWSWALYAYHLPDRTPHLLAASDRPESQTHMPEPRAEGDAFAWLQGGGPGHPLLARLWVRGQTATPRVLASVEETRASPFLSLSGGLIWLDERDPQGGRPSLRAVGSTGHEAGVWAFDSVANYPVVAGTHVAFASSGDPSDEEAAEPLRRVHVARLDDGGGGMRDVQEVASARDVWDLAWLDDVHLVVAGSEGVDVVDVRTPGRRVARLVEPLATAARVGDGHLVTVTRAAGRDVVRSYQVAR